MIMRRMFLLGAVVLLVVCGLSAQVSHAPLAERIAHTDTARFRHMPSVHNGAGPMDYMQLFGPRDAQSAKFELGTNLYFLHRGIIPPGGGIGAHFHNQCEEMFIILDGEAQFTVDGRTSV